MHSVSLCARFAYFFGLTAQTSVRYKRYRKERPALPLQGIRKEYENESGRTI